MKSSKTWVLIADAGRARVLERTGKGEPLGEIAGMHIEAHVPRSQDIVSDRQGTTMVSGGAVRHAYTPQTDPHREAKRQFMQQLAAKLDEHLAAG